jgi:hypothetical protein
MQGTLSVSVVSCVPPAPDGEADLDGVIGHTGRVPALWEVSELLLP